MKSLSWLKQVYLIQLRTLITYRLEFWLNFFGRMILHTLMGYFLWNSIFKVKNVETMNGYTMQVLIFYYLLAPIIQGAIQGETIGFLSREIYEGGLNKYIVYPINVAKYKFASYLSFSTLYFLQLFLIIMCYQLFYHSYYIGLELFFSLLKGFCTLFLATILYYFISLLIELAAFWFDQIWSLGVMFRFTVTFLSGVAIPIDFFPQWGQKVLSMTPFPYLITLPIKSFLNQISTSDFLYGIAFQLFWITVFIGLGLLAWNKGKYRYSGIGI